MSRSGMNCGDIFNCLYVSSRYILHVWWPVLSGLPVLKEVTGSCLLARRCLGNQPGKHTTCFLTESHSTTSRSRKHVTICRPDLGRSFKWWPRETAQGDGKGTTPWWNAPSTNQKTATSHKKTLLPSSRKSAGATGNMLIPTLLDNASRNVMTRPSSLTVLGWSVMFG